MSSHVGQRKTRKLSQTEGGSIDMTVNTRQDLTEFFGVKDIIGIIGKTQRGSDA